MKWIRAQWDAIDRAIFGFGSPVTLSAFRIIVGFLSFINFLMLSVDLQTWFGERGLYPTWMAERFAGEFPRFTLLGEVTDFRVVVVLYVLTLVASLMVMFGLWTRASTIALFVLAVSFHHRNPDVLHSGDWLLRAWMFIIMLGPSGAALSLDRIIGLRRGTVQIDLPTVSLWPQRLVQIQLALVYFMTVWLKWGGSFWRDGTATYYPAQLREFDRFPVPDFLNQPPFTMVTTYGTLFVELALATLLCAKPLRKFVLIAGLCLHGYIEYSMNIPLFQWVIVAAFICHYESEELQAWWSRMTTKFPILKSVFRTPEPKEASEHTGSPVHAE